MHCTNISSQQIQDWSKEFNKSPEYIGGIVSLWQESNNRLDEFPSKLWMGEQIKSSNKENEVSFALKSVDILSSPKADEIFRKGDKNNWSLEKILQELQVPKEQQELIKSFDTRNREEIITSLLAENSFTVEINTAKEKSSMTKEIKSVNGFSINGDIYDRTTDEDVFGVGDKEIFTKNNSEISEQEYRYALYEYNHRVETPTQYYSNLTVPGGTNYTEQEIATPAITPSIKGHAQFATSNGIGWFRSDEQAIGNKVIAEPNIEQSNGMTFIHSELEEDKSNSVATKTRRILELQSDLFQKGRDKDNLINEYSEEYQNVDGNTIDEIIENRKNIKSNQFLQLLNKDNNWVNFFVKAIIQDSAKETTQEVQQEDVEAKVRELEKEGLLEIDCKGKLKAEKGLVTSFTKNSKWEIVKDLKGYPSHAQGGVDIKLGKDGFSFTRGSDQIMAAHGLVLPKIR